MEASKREKWDLIWVSGNSPKIFSYRFLSDKGVYFLDFEVMLNEKGEPRPFGSIYLTENNKKVYRFKHYEELIRFLQKKGLPLSGIENIARLWLLI
jgi:hypothetical protein